MSEKIHEVRRARGRFADLGYVEIVAAAVDEADFLVEGDGAGVAFPDTEPECLPAEFARDVSVSDQRRALFKNPLLNGWPLPLVSRVVDEPLWYRVSEHH